jgi:membrane protein implicated in regulation of membrane protease activity
VTAKNWLAVLCLVAGVPLAAYGLAGGMLPLALAGLALVLVALALVAQWIARADRPQQQIKPAADSAWRMKDAPPGAPRQSDGTEAR